MKWYQKPRLLICRTHVEISHWWLRVEKHSLSNEDKQTNKRTNKQTDKYTNEQIIKKEKNVYNG